MNLQYTKLTFIKLKSNGIKLFTFMQLFSPIPAVVLFRVPASKNSKQRQNSSRYAYVM
jgi:hypothetical protein